MKLHITIAAALITQGWFTGAFSVNTKLPAHQKASALSSHKDISLSRRETLKSWTSAALIAASLVISEESLAFPNKISTKYDDRPKQRGAVPKGLGVGMRKDMTGEEYIGLKPCGAGESFRLLRKVYDKIFSLLTVANL